MDTIERLEEILAENDMSMQELCKKSGVPRSTLGRTKQRGGQLSLDTIERVCIALDMRPFEFFMTYQDWRFFDSLITARAVKAARGDLHEHRTVRPV